jgi:quinol monooxygenase YgiN
MQIKPEKTELYEKTCLELRELMQKHEPEGAPIFELARDPKDPCVYHVFEAYKDQAAIDHHTSTDYYKRTAAVFVECLAGNHLEEIKRRGLTGREMYSLINSLKLEAYETLE